MSNFQKDNDYDMITDNVAIGSHKASYDAFDLIINLDYPHNGIKFREIVYEKKEDKQIIKCGYIDVENGGLTSDSLNKLLNIINDYKKEIKKDDPKILFHCYAGVSRSATVAIYYLSKTQNKTTKEVYELAKEKRPCINPNSAFRKIIDLEINEDKNNKFAVWLP